MNTMQVKICGITNLEDARVATDAGADLLGFIFFAKSPRYIAPETAAIIVSAIREEAGSTTPKFVGVVVNEKLDRVAQIQAQVGLDFIQFHGDELPAALAQFPHSCYKALRPASNAQAIEEAPQFALATGTAGPVLMLDAYDTNEYGGTGKKADWQVAAQLAKQHPGLLLAGGLSPDNVVEAIRVVEPWGVDVASGVEALPGKKDHAKVRAFVAQARGVRG